MKRFELKASLYTPTSDNQKTPQTTTQNSIKTKPYIGLLPIVLFIIITFSGLLWTGYNNTPIDAHEKNTFSTLSTFLGNSNANQAILWSSAIALVSSIILTSFNKKNTRKIPLWIWESIQKIKSTLAVLICAWILSSILIDLGLKDYLSQLIINNEFPPPLFPALVFVTAAIISFSTGSSWSAMGILYPIVIPIASSLSSYIELNNSLVIFYCSISSILAGSVWGDHCSPISDTTIISSLSADCKHINHVKSQLPYALLVGVVSLLFGIIPVSYNLEILSSFTITTILIALIFNRLSSI